MSPPASRRSLHFKERERDVSPMFTSADQMEERMSEEVRKYDHLYNPSLADYKDAQMALNSWRQISANVGLPVEECTKLWRKMRDKYVRQKKNASRSSSGDAGGKKVPAFYLFLSWLGPHIKHRARSSNHNKPSTASMVTSQGSSPSTSSSLESSPKPSTSTPHEASVQPATSIPDEASVQQATSVPEASVQQPSTCSPLPGLQVLSDPPASMMSPSSPSRKAQRKRKREQDQQDHAEMEILEQGRTALTTYREEDEDTRFAAALVDVLRNVPADSRYEARRSLYNMAVDFLKK